MRSVARRSRSGVDYGTGITTPLSQTITVIK